MKRGLAGLAVIVALATALSAVAASDGQIVRKSRHGIYLLTVSPRPATAPVNRLHTWHLVLRRPNHSPVRKAMIKVDGDMPAHGHGLPTRPRVRELGKGRYVVEGMKFQMGGAWYVAFTIKAKPGRDTVRIDFELPPA